MRTQKRDAVKTLLEATPASEPEAAFTTKQTISSDFAADKFGQKAVTVTTTVGLAESDDEEKALAAEVEALRAALPGRQRKEEEVRLKVPTLDEVKRRKRMQRQKRGAVASKRSRAAGGGKGGPAKRRRK